MAEVSGRSSKKNKKSGSSPYKGRKFGRVLTKMGKVTREQIYEGLALQKKRKGKLGDLLVELGHIQPSDILEALAGQSGMDLVNLDKIKFSEEAIAAVPAETANAYQVAPLKYDESSRSLIVAISSPDNFGAVDDLRLLMGFKVKAVLAPEEQVTAFLKKHYTSSAGTGLNSVYEELSDRSDLASLEGRGDSVDLSEIAAAAEDNQVVKLINLVLLQAIKDRASDIHFEPFEDEFKMRYRIDGVLYEMVPPPVYLAMPVASRIKVMANLDIAERRVPQDGRIELQVGGNPVDLRVAVLPTMFGESVVMRVLDRSNVQLSIEKVGLREDDLEKVSQLIKKPNGIIVVTGPTGSGKTTTLYAALQHLNNPDVKILTAEDPVEYDLDGLVQCQINTDIDLTFGRLLRSFLRQDPDIILVGEIRDKETANIAVQAALTGHLVFSTLHTNDAPSSIVRLLDLGLEHFLVTATVEAIVAQRLVRRICGKCKEEYTPSESELMELGLRPEDVQGQILYRGRGCDECNRSGYKGRMALYEIMVMDDDLREMVMNQASTNLLRAEARKRGMRTLRECGLLGIFEGQTTIDEVVRETIMEEG